MAGGSAPPVLRRIMDFWHQLECWVAVAAFAFIAIILVLDVFGREIIGPLFKGLDVDIGPTGIFASTRLAMYALFIGSFLGVAIATATGSHIVPRVGFGWVPKSWGPAMDRFADVLTGLFLLGFVYFAIIFVHSSYSIGLRAPVLDWAVWPIQTTLPLGFASAALRYFIYAVWPSVRPKLPEFQE
jgi:TRAP-type C4-dicarboxylate transport system permease small subunit